jgi:hypothetical protein
MNPGEDDGAIGSEALLEPFVSMTRVKMFADKIS